MANIKNLPLIQAFRQLKGNSRITVYTEIFWSIPYNLYAPFISVYMYALGVSYKQIGLLTSIVTLLQFFTAFLGGVLTDKFGRRATLFAADMIAWTVSCFIYMLSQNFYWFLVAAALNSAMHIAANAWTCLLVEDADKRTLTNTYNWIYILGQAAIFLAPLSVYLVGRLTVVPAMRILYAFACISMSIKFVLMFFYTTETERGKQCMKETKGVSVFALLNRYKATILEFFTVRSPALFKTLALMTILQITTSLTATFFGLYVTEELGVPERYLAYFPILRSVVMLVFFFSIQSVLNRFPVKLPLLVGILCYIISFSVLITPFIPLYTRIVLYILVEACAFAIVIPRKDVIVVLFLPPKKRAEVMSIMMSIMLLISMPFGYIGGFLSNIDGSLPFVLNIVLLSLAAVVVSLFKRTDTAESDAS